MYGWCGKLLVNGMGKIVGHSCFMYSSKEITGYADHKDSGFTMTGEAICNGILHP